MITYIVVEAIDYDESTNAFVGHDREQAYSMARSRRRETKAKSIHYFVETWENGVCIECEEV